MPGESESELAIAAGRELGYAEELFWRREKRGKEGKRIDLR
jgi:hypothetical protein